jgi:hypothetical protein
LIGITEGIDGSESIGMLIECMNEMHILAVVERHKASKKWLPIPIETEMNNSPFKTLGILRSSAIFLDISKGLARSTAHPSR